MTSCQFNPPLSPTGTSSLTDGGRNGGNLAATKSPYFSIASQFLPRNLHDVIRWARFITTQSPVTTEVIRKLATFPITDFVIDSEKPATLDRYNSIFKSFRLKATLHDIGFEYYTIGNVFLSIYFPIHRTLTCSRCGAEFNAKKAEFAEFRNFQFTGECPSCSANTTFTRKDTKGFDVNDMNIIKWDPINIAVNHNPITNEYEYYYRIPNEIRRRVRQGDRLFVNSVPWSFIEAVQKNQDFKFDNNNIFHLKNVSAGHMIEGVAIPPLISQYNLVFYQATLRKANESIASDYMAPLRVIYPSAQTGNSDPVISMSMKNFVSNIQTSLIQHKQDQNHVLIAPVPIGYQAISGEGKALLVSQEIAQAEESLLLSMGVSRELLSGTTNWTSSTVGLRMLENTMLTYTGQIEEFIEWVISRVTKYLSLETAKVTLVPFKLTDDEALRQVLGTLIQTGDASMSTLMESYGLDYKEELKKVKQDAIDKAVAQAQAHIEVERGVFLGTKDVSGKLGNDNQFKDALSKAQQMAEQLSQSDMGTRRQVLNHLKVEDYASYLMVSKLLEEYNEANNAQMHAEHAQAEAQAGSPAGEASAGQTPATGPGEEPAGGGTAAL